MPSSLVLIRGAGDLASGVAVRLFNSGFRVVMTECSRPSSIRRTVCFSEAVYDGTASVEGVRAVRVENADQALVASCGKIAVLVDENLDALSVIKPDVLVDAVIAKRNIGTSIDQAPLVIALGPGFEAGVDAHYVIETKRGHYLGRIISSGSAIANTGIPGDIAGVTKQRVIHSSTSGVLKVLCDIGKSVEAGCAIASIDGDEQRTEISGVIRGMIRDGFCIPRSGYKIADIDPRPESADYIHTVSDKARCIAGSVLECIISHQHRMKNIEHSGADTKIDADDLDFSSSELIAYTDGSYNIRTHEYSYGALLISKSGETKEIYRRFEKGDNSKFRNVAGELEGSMAVMNYCIVNGIKSVRLCYDYQGIESWATGEWKANNPLTQYYKEFTKEAFKTLNVDFVKVKAHSSDKYNQRADELAALALKKGE